MSAVSECIRTLGYFKRKYRHLMTGPDDIVGTNRKAGGKRGTGKRGTSISPEEHDQIFAEAQRPDLSLAMIARKHGRAISLICRVKNRRHPLYDAQRCEPLVKEAKP